MKRWYRIAAAVCLISLLGAIVPSVASADETSNGTTTPTPTTPAEDAFRASLATYLQNLGSALTATAQNPETKAAVAPRLQDDTAALAVANQQLPALTAEQLDAMQGILGQNPTWQQQPLIVQQRVSSPPKAPLPANMTPPPGFLSDCTANLGDLKGLFYGYWAAAQVASAANAVASGMPDGADFVAADIIAGVIFGVANGIAIVLNANLSLAADCATAVANAALAATYPTDGSGNLTPASSQISVNTLTVVSQGIQTTLDTMQTTINTITGKLTGVINSLGTAQGTANAIQVIVTDLGSRTDSLLNVIGKPSDQATDVPGSPPAGTANGLANTINTREDTTLANTAAFQALMLRAEIERNLASSSMPAIALFVLPASQGGYLELTRSIVTTTINSMTAAGQTVGTAQSFLTAGNTAFTAGQYETAYNDYDKAYQTAVN